MTSFSIEYSGWHADLSVDNSIPDGCFFDPYYDMVHPFKGYKLLKLFRVPSEIFEAKVNIDTFNTIVARLSPMTQELWNANPDMGTLLAP